MLDALDATHPYLAPQQGWTPPPPASPGSLFGARPRRQVARTHQGGQPRIQITIRPTRDQHAVIEQLWRELGAPSCSALIAAALDRYLDPAER